MEKTVIYYLAYTKETKLQLQSEEIASAKWCSFGEAFKRLTHDNNRELLKEAARFLNVKL